MWLVLVVSAEVSLNLYTVALIRKHLQEKKKINPAGDFSTRKIRWMIVAVALGALLLCLALVFFAVGRSKTLNASQTTPLNNAFFSGEVSLGYLVLGHALMGLHVPVLFFIASLLVTINFSTKKEVHKDKVNFDDIVDRAVPIGILGSSNVRSSAHTETQSLQVLEFGSALLELPGSGSENHLISDVSIGNINRGFIIPDSSYQNGLEMDTNRFDIGHSVTLLDLGESVGPISCPPEYGTR